ncbi:cysteine-rich RLK RECEPTOR-like protein kinase [Cucumis melo var. makuwa]|uniref:Cysteine-rich RLK RECEPTOR-like protein kinase n=1 Tax=Cucumis melo var. makuwa TaxID=1194695 RepID=A0A5A7SGQ5_CUCMM|nr:cysteine-rich RLK RECEPTOR-like protein kinase [Cucumis melo var. makuwa]
MEKLLQNLQKTPIYPTGVVSQPYAPPSDQKMIHAPLVSDAWAHAPSSFHVTAHPIPFYAPSDVQPSNPSSHPHPHAPSMSSGQQPSTVNLSNQYSKQQLYADSLQQPLFSGNEIDQPQNRSNIEAGESSTHSKPTELPMYSKNPVTSFPNSQSNYMGSSTGNFSGEKLNGQNYFSWSQSIKMFLEGRYQFGFLTGETVRPPPGDALERLWKGENSLIRSMLINSIEPQIGKPLLYVATAKDLWDTTQTLYSKRQNASRLYTMRKQVHNCKQGTLDVTTYFNKLSLLWQEMDLCRETVWDTPNDSTQYAKLEEVDRVYDFLAGLNPKFDNVCGRILGQRPLPSLMEVCFEVRLEEDRTNVMGVLTTPTIDSAAFSARSSNHDSDKNNGKSIPVCEHCKKQWHTKDQCWKLHGRPPGGKKRSSNEKQNSGRAYISETTPASTSQSTDPTASQTKTPTLSAIAQSGMPQSLGLISVDGKNPWILDSGATDHLTGSSEHFISYAPCAGNEKIRIADGSLAPIAGKGQIVPFDGFALQNVLHVPKLSYNLLSISKITRELHCKAIFLPESVYFQDMSSGRTIGTARHSRGLYILDDDTSCSSLSRGPSKVTTSSGKRWFVTFIDNHTRLTWVYLHQPLGLRLMCLLGIPFTNAGENVSEESNSTFEFVEPTPITVSDIDPHPIILHTNQVPWKTYYRRNLRKEVGSPTSQPPAPVQNFEPPRDQGMENPTKPCTNNTMSENDKSDVAVLENMEEKNRDDETEVRIETSNDEAEQGHTRKLDEYDLSLDIPIALRKGTRSCTKHPICNYVSYDNLSLQFRAFTASLDSTIIPKNIYTALECPEWKNAVMEEMKALEKNRTWEICALPKGHKTVGCKWVFSLKYKADETFSPVAKLNTVRVLLSVAVNKELPLYQLDVKNAFLNGDLVEEVYMSPPPGFEAQFGKIAILIVHVDDIVLTGDDQTEISQLKKRMGDEFEIKDLGNLKYFLGMEVARSKEGISVSQRKYTLDLLTEIGMLGCRPADTPIEFNCKLGNSDDQVPVDKEQYQRLVGKLIYLSHTRPDISFAVSVVSQFMQAPYEKHMEAVNRILRYLKNTPGNLVTWRNKKQSVVARSSAEAEYRAMSLGICEEIWLQKVLSDLHQECETPLKLFCDNKVAISIANNPVQHDRTKHVEIDRHFIKERLDSGSICIPYIPSSQQIADVLTKGLLRPHFDLCVTKLGLIDIYLPT